MAYDPLRHEIILFGGDTSQPTLLGDTWAWTAAQGWTELTLSNAPAARFGGSLVFDPALGKLFLFGGETTGGVQTGNDNWTFDGSSWQQLAISPSPPPRVQQTMTFDDDLNAVVLWGGVGIPGYLHDTWLFTGSAWIQVPDSGTHPGSDQGQEAVMAYDPAIRAAVLLGGGSTSNAEWALQTAIVDGTVPVTQGSIAPPPNVAGWNRTTVNVTLSATDADGLSDVQGITYSTTGAESFPSTTVPGSTATVTVSIEGTTTLSYFATDQTGNQELPKTLVIKIDKTKPVVTFTGNQDTYTVDQNITITCTATDPPASNGQPASGLALSTCQNVSAPAYAFSLGPNTVSATPTDVAGNVGTGSTTFTVEVTNASLCALSRPFVSNEGMASGMCTVLDAAALTERLGADRGKAGLLRAYQQMVQAAQRSKFLSAEHAAILNRLAATL